MSVQPALGRAIAALRAERGMSRYDLIAAADMSYPYLAEIEKGSKTPSSRLLRDIASGLQCAPSDVLKRAEQIAADPRNGVMPGGESA